MYTSFFRACLFLICFIISLTVNAAGLGKLTINSFLGQPLNAEIDLVSVSDGELSSLKADFASHEAFAQAGIPYDPIFSTFKVSIEPRANGQSYVKITSQQSVNEPFLNLLVELSWASGRLLREYMVLLDPAENKQSEPVSPVVPAISEAAAVSEASPVVPDKPHTMAASVEQIAETVQSEPLPVAKQATSVKSPGTYGPILAGDTLSSIARQVKSDEISINQMLVALYRENRDAFIANNMNLLKTGAVLKIPDLQELTQISEKDARAEVRIQTSDWHAYRQNLAESTQDSQELEAYKQIDSGQITTTVDSGESVQSEAPQEVLRLSSGESSREAQNSDQNTLERMRMMEEDAIARNLALEEANERVAILEKNIENLQKLLALQHPELAQAQVNAQESQTPQTDTESIEVIPSESIRGAETEVDIISEGGSAIELDALSESDTMISLPEAEGEDRTETTSLTETEQATSTSATAPMTMDTLSVGSVANPLQPTVVEGASLLNQVMDNNMTYIGAGSAVFLLLAIALIIRRRKKIEEEAAIEKARNEELSSALRNKTAAVVAAAHAGDNSGNETENFDDFDKSDQFLVDEDSQEKEFHSKTDLFSDTDDEAKSLEREAFDSYQAIELDFPDENEKAENKSENQFNEADAINDAFEENKPEFGDLDDLSSESGNNEIDSGSNFSEQSLLEDGPTLNEGDDFSVFDDKTQFRSAEKKASVDDEHLIDFSDNESTESGSNDDYALKMDVDKSASSQQEPDALKVNPTDAKPEVKSLSSLESEPTSAADNTLDFSVDTSMIDLSDEDIRNKEVDFSDNSSDSETQLTDLLEESNSKSEPLNSELQEVDLNEGLSSDSLKQTPEINFSDINLDVENTSKASVDQAKVEDTAAKIADTNLKGEQWHAVKTKIDLAKAYLEMEDNEGAREMLEEVLREGDVEQQDTAQALLEKL